MSVAKHLEVTSSSTKSFEDAIKVGIEKASETVNNLEGAWVKEQKIIINNNKIAEYRVNLKLTFIID